MDSRCDLEAFRPHHVRILAQLRLTRSCSTRRGSTLAVFARLSSGRRLGLESGRPFHARMEPATYPRSIWPRPTVERSGATMALGETDMVRQPVVPRIPRPSNRVLQVVPLPSPRRRHFHGIGFRGCRFRHNSAISHNSRSNSRSIPWPRDGLSSGGSTGWYLECADTAVHTSTNFPTCVNSSIPFTCFPPTRPASRSSFM